MKKTIALFLLLSLLLCGCAKEQPPVPETVPVPQETAIAETTLPEPELSAELDAFRRVLEGRMSIFRIASQEAIPVSKISLFFTAEELPWTVAQFAVHDLDGDGLQEMVLELSDYAGFVLLHYQEDGSITGEEVWYRAMRELKADGSYIGSGSSFDRYYWKFHHVADVLLAQCYKREDGTAVYEVAGEAVDEAAFIAFEEDQAAKPGAVWYESWEDYLNSQT